ESPRQLLVFEYEVFIVDIVDDCDRIVIDQSFSSLNTDDGERHPDHTVLTDPDIGLYVAHLTAVAQQHARLARKGFEIDLLNSQLGSRSADDRWYQLLAARCQHQGQAVQQKFGKPIHRFFGWRSFCPTVRCPRWPALLSPTVQRPR